MKERMFESSPERERPESRKSRGAKKFIANEKSIHGSLNYINNINNNVIIVHGGGIGAIAPVLKKAKIGGANYNGSST